MNPLAAACVEPHAATSLAVVQPNLDLMLATFEGCRRRSTVFRHPDFDDHEQVLFARDIGAGLQAIVAVHSTVLGPAFGGCRMCRTGTKARR